MPSTNIKKCYDCIRFFDLMDTSLQCLLWASHWKANTSINKLAKLNRNFGLFIDNSCTTQWLNTVTISRQSLWKKNANLFGNSFKWSTEEEWKYINEDSNNCTEISGGSSNSNSKIWKRNYIAIEKCRRRLYKNNS